MSRVGLLLGLLFLGVLVESGRGGRKDNRLPAQVTAILAKAEQLELLSLMPQPRAKAPSMVGRFWERPSPRTRAAAGRSERRSRRGLPGATARSRSAFVRVMAFAPRTTGRRSIWLCASSVRKSRFTLTAWKARPS